MLICYYYFHLICFCPSWHTHGPHPWLISTSSAITHTSHDLSPICGPYHCGGKVDNAVEEKDNRYPKGDKMPLIITCIFMECCPTVGGHPLHHPCLHRCKWCQSPWGHIWQPSVLFKMSPLLQASWYPIQGYYVVMHGIFCWGHMWKHCHFFFSCWQHCSSIYAILRHQPQCPSDECAPYGWHASSADRIHFLLFLALFCWEHACWFHFSFWIYVSIHNGTFIELQALLAPPPTMIKKCSPLTLYHLFPMAWLGLVNMFYICNRPDPSSISCSSTPSSTMWMGPSSQCPKSCSSSGLDGLEPSDTSSWRPSSCISLTSVLPTLICTSPIRF